MDGRIDREFVVVKLSDVLIPLLIEFVDDKLSTGVDCRSGLTLKQFQDFEEKNSFN